MYKIKTELN